MRVLVAFECSGVVRDAFRAKGHDAYSCDLKMTDPPSAHHLHGDAMKALYLMPWDLVIAHPPCTYLCSSGLHWNHRRPERQKLTDDAVFEVRLFVDAAKAYVQPLRLAIENPVGCLSTRLRKPDQIIQPYHFGEDASKATCLWLWGLPPLRPTGFVEPRMVAGKPRWANQTDSGQNRLGPSPERAADRARTYNGIAAAMAAQWG
jgi:hypothetical protein